jgi:catechol 2,3-dioxygenase-like lactoylglutathione lyase family enzyme
MAQPAIAMAGSAASRASDFPNDHPAILIAVSSPASPGDCRAAHEKSPTGVFPYGLCHDRRCTDPAARQQSPKAEMVSCHLDNIAAAARPGWNCGCTAATLAALQPAERRNNKNGETEMPTVIWDHVHLRSPDPEATAAWLEDILGGEIIRGPGRIDVKLGGANVFIAPVTAGDGVNTPPVTPYQGLDHFGLTVKDIDAVAAEIKAKGVEFTKEPTTIRPGVRICFIRGPQGISIELLERDKKYA